MAEPQITRGDVARGAGLAGLSRAGALIELVAQPLYTWMFGLATYGVYVVLWGAVNLLTNLLDLSMPAALQRVVPGTESEERAHGAVKAALLLTVVPATLVALLISVNAESAASLLSAAPEDRADLPTAIALFAWALPLWTFVEVATAAVRARRAFGPEIRLRIFWEQLARILFALGAFAAGLQSTGLVIAHLCSLLLTAILCVRLLGRHYPVRKVAAAPLPPRLLRNLLLTGLALLPSNFSRRMLIDAPPVLLNLMLPGARGASAAGLFEIARKIGTVPQIVRQSFQYVLAPLSSAQARQDRSAVGPLYLFSTRVSAALVVPLAGLLAFTGRDILSVYRPEAAAALPLIYILAGTRAAEAVAGPAVTVIETIGHRLLPVLNSLLAVAVWAVLAFLLAPDLGAMGMIVAVAAATMLSVYAASIELRVSEGLSPFSRKLFQGFGISLAGVLAMGIVERATAGPVGFVLLVLLWAATSWAALRFGLTREDREALGGLSRRLRLVDART